MKRCMLLACLTFLLLFLPSFAMADTGTYEILAYRVTMMPLPGGKTELTYYQQWKVLSGRIPWITVGMANEYFTIPPGRMGGAANRIESKNGRSWSGVHVTLDRDYQEGEVFEVEFTVLQRGLLYSEDDTYRFDFKPGWYDRAPIHELSLEMKFFEDHSGVTCTPEPDSIDGQNLLWKRQGLARGQSLHLEVFFPKSVFPGSVEVAPPRGARSDRPQKAIKAIFIIIGGVIIGLIIAVIVRAQKAGRRYGGGGHVGLGGIHHRSGSCVVSCACACVACACACACAGGGAAGCDRKTVRTCPLCADCTHADCPLRVEPGKKVSPIST